MTVRYLDVAGAAKYLRYGADTLYAYTSRRMIPFLKAGGRDLFRISELDLWLNMGADYNAAAKIVIDRKYRMDDENINMNADEIAQYLYLAVSTVYDLKYSEKIPYIKMRKNLLFRTTEIDKWLDYGGTYEIAMMIMSERATLETA